MRILLVDDEPAFVRGLRATLEQHGFEVVVAYDGEEAWKRFKDVAPDFVLLDVMLPGVDGQTLCRRIRAQGDTPVIMLTARGAERDRVLGLETGADDYVVKPVSGRELVARIRAVQRRAGPDGPHGRARRRVELGPLVLDPDTREARLRGRRLSLTPKEFDLLLHLARRPGVVHSRGDLLLEVWGYEAPADSRTVDVHISRLREKLGDPDATGLRLLTVWGRGYRLVHVRPRHG
ncbi:MAG: response regulator transcription factor [Clostridia bacterium]|nr:response regulator transcription factor [Clostridia bacterium]